MINRLHIYPWACLGALAFTAFGVGCRQETKPAGAPAPRPTPEASFKEIAAMVKEGIEISSGDMPSGFVSRAGGGRTQFTIRNTVTSQFLPPENPGGVPRGKITVTSNTVYSMVRSATETDEENSDQNANQPTSTLDEGTEDSGAQVFDKDLVTGSEGSAKGPGDVDIVSRRADEDVRAYELAYENDHWVLKSTLDPKTEQSVQSAFERALRLQP